MCMGLLQSGNSEDGILVFKHPTCGAQPVLAFARSRPASVRYARHRLEINWVAPRTQGLYRECIPLNGNAMSKSLAIAINCASLARRSQPVRVAWTPPQGF